MSTTRFGLAVKHARSEQGKSLTAVARASKMDPSYLFRIEEGVYPPPSKDKVERLAVVLGQNVERMLALAGRIPSDVQTIIERNPEKFAALIRAADMLSPDAFDVLLTRVIEESGLKLSECLRIRRAEAAHGIRHARK